MFDPTISIMEDLINITPTMQKQIIRMRLDHTNLPMHKARFIHNTDTLCSTCQKQCDVQHILVECSDYLTTRQLLFDQLLFATSSKFNKLSIQNIDLEAILGFDIRLNSQERTDIFNSLSIFLRNTRVNVWKTKPEYTRRKVPEARYQLNSNTRRHWYIPLWYKPYWKHQPTYRQEEWQKYIKLR